MNTHNQSPLFLIGFMGSGKSTLGRKLAQLLDRPFIDLDHFIESREQSTISQLFELKGEDGFREMERSALQSALKIKNAIIATGGGTPCFYNNMEIMNRAGITLYLKLSPKTLVQRLAPGRAHRPLIAGKTLDGLLAYVSQKLAERESFYKKAILVADAEHLSPEDYVQMLIRRQAQEPEGKQ